MHTEAPFNLREPRSPVFSFSRAALAAAFVAAHTNAWAQAAAPAPSPKAAGMMALFWQSADVFTALVAVGSVIAVALILRAFLELRERVLLPARSIQALRDRIERADWNALRDYAQTDDSFASRVLAAGLRPTRGGRQGAREAAELAASEESSRWFRRVEMLNVIGHLGPLLGLVGTVYGMIIAFAALGETGGQAGPGELSLGISKALFHTFLGLMLAIPSLLAYGYFRGVADRLCTRALTISAELFEALPDDVFTHDEPRTDRPGARARVPAEV